MFPQYRCLEGLLYIMGVPMPRRPHWLQQALRSRQSGTYPNSYERTEEGLWREAVMDVTVTWPLSAATRLLVVTLRSAHSESVGSYVGRPQNVHSYDKQQRYGTRVEPLVVEVGGRMPQQTLETLRRLAGESCTGTRLHARRGACIKAHSLRRTPGGACEDRRPCMPLQRAWGA